MKINTKKNFLAKSQIENVVFKLVHAFLRIPVGLNDMDSELKV